MTNKHKTIEQCLNEAADEFLASEANTRFHSDNVMHRAMQIYADSCVSAKLEEVREKLLTNEQIAEYYPDNAENEMDTFYLNSLQHMKRMSVQVFRDQVKELLK